MSGRLKPYFYFVLRCGTIPDSLQQAMKPVHVVGNRKHIRQDFPLGADDEAIVLILRDINWQSCWWQRLKRTVKGGIMNIEIKSLRKKDYKKAIQFAVKGMHFDWYLDSPFC